MQQLERSLRQFGERWELNPGDGAFYGPKVSEAINQSLDHLCDSVAEKEILRSHV